MKGMKIKNFSGSLAEEMYKERIVINKDLKKGELVKRTNSDEMCVCSTDAYLGLNPNSGLVGMDLPAWLVHLVYLSGPKEGQTEERLTCELEKVNVS